ncbi:MAG: hypothetical protein V8T87_02170 [Victivallales bacterium]
MMPESTIISMPWNYTLPGIEQRAAELSITVEKISTTFLRSQTKEQIRHFLEQEDFTRIHGLSFMGLSRRTGCIAQYSIPFCSRTAASTGSGRCRSP